MVLLCVVLGECPRLQNGFFFWSVDLLTIFAPCAEEHLGGTVQTSMSCTCRVIGRRH